MTMITTRLYRSFTLVEMLIVVVIIGVLAAALIPRLVGAQSQARDSARITTMNQVAAALESYMHKEGAYPTGNCVTDLVSPLSGEISNMPGDPQKSKKNYGAATSTGTCVGQFVYVPLRNGTTNNGSYALLSNMEVFGKNMNYKILKNFTINDSPSSYSGGFCPGGVNKGSGSGCVVSTALSGGRIIFSPNVTFDAPQVTSAPPTFCSSLIPTNPIAAQYKCRDYFFDLILSGTKFSVYNSPLPVSGEPYTIFGAGNNLEGMAKYPRAENCTATVAKAQSIHGNGKCYCQKTLSNNDGFVAGWKPTLGGSRGSVFRITSAVGYMTSNWDETTISCEA